MGVQLSSNLSWEVNLQEKERELRGRIGILRRLSWHLPRNIMIKCLSPIFTSKLMFGLELMADPLKHFDRSQPNCSIINRLQPLLNEAVRAALRLHRSQHISQEELMRRGKQLTVASLAERALANQTWNALGTEERRISSCLSQRIERGQVTRVTRQNQGENIPPQTTQKTLVTRISQMWNFLPDDIRQERVKSSAKTKVKALFEN